MKKLIVNGDDFGLHPSVDQAILQACRAGCLKSASFMATGGAAEEAADIARREPGLSVGLHFSLVAEKPVSPAEKISSLVESNGSFPADHRAFIGKYLRGQINLREVAIECEAQLRRMEKLGLQPSHFDSHQHLHALPGITEVCIDAMKRHGIKRMRCPAEGYFFRGGLPLEPVRFLQRGGLTFLAQRAGQKARRQGIKMPDHFFGMMGGGQMTGKNLRLIIRQLPEGISEVMIHPGANRELLENKYGWGYSWEGELKAVTETETRELLRALRIEATSYRAL